MTCLRRAVASSPVAWLMDSIAWHPSPTSRCLYAIAQADSTLHLMDGCHHRCLRAWSWAELSEQPAPADESPNDLPLELTWSPEGSRLAVAGSGMTIIVCFDSHLA